MFASTVRRSPALVFASALLVVSSVGMSCSNASASSPKSSSTIAETQLAVLSIRVGLDAESLTAAGVASTSVAATVTALADASTNLATPLATLDAAYTSARSAVNAAQRKIQGGAATQDEIAAFPSLETALANAESARTAALDALFTSATASVSAAQRTALSAIRGNRGWKLPVEFLVVSRTEAEWIVLRDALSNERTAAKNGDTPNATCQSLLGTARANASVAAARTALDTSLASVTTAWNTATEG